MVAINVDGISSYITGMFASLGKELANTKIGMHLPLAPCLPIPSGYSNICDMIVVAFRVHLMLVYDSRHPATT